MTTLMKPFKPCERGHTSPRRSGNCLECQAESNRRYRERQRAMQAERAAAPPTPELRAARIRSLVAELYFLVLKD